MLIITPQEVFNNVITLVAGVQKFQIGLTNHPVKELFIEKYSDQYDDVIEICYSEDQDYINQFIFELLDFLAKDSSIAKKINSGPRVEITSTESGVFRVYLVYRH